MKRSVLVGLLIAAAAAVVALVLSMRSALPEGGGGAAPAVAGPKNLSVTIGTETFDLRDGVAGKPAAPGSATVNTVRIVGEPVTGDADGDGAPDAALLLQNDPGGSGTFYYAVLAVNHDGTYRATNALPLGDRISPEGIDFTDGSFVYRVLERKADEPMMAAPSVEKRVPINLDPASDRISIGS
ncbi:hypothetical protein [Mycolicibacterium sp.]|uniref:hypothetical protein n=1 Tax=Mycolicibacterium sp. TaxID=2320850 RepID=UPI0028A917F2|nr:hypothetical protein [Mycolicibacterium sp.]